MSCGSTAKPRAFLAIALGVLGPLACVGEVDSKTGDVPGSGNVDGGGRDGGSQDVDGGSSGSDGGFVPDPTDSEGEPAELSGITVAHNEVRAGVGVAPLSWDDELEAVAQAWAEQCVNDQAPLTLIDHNPGRSNNYPGYVGENIAGGPAPMSGAAAVQLWASEGASYDYDSNSCSGPTCGHYTQVVWSASTELGCARSDCPEIANGQGIICNYAPGGNTGGRPY